MTDKEHDALKIRNRQASDQLWAELREKHWDDINRILLHGPQTWDEREIRLVKKVFAAVSAELFMQSAEHGGGK